MKGRTGSLHTPTGTEGGHGTTCSAEQEDLSSGSTPTRVPLAVQFYQAPLLSAPPPSFVWGNFTLTLVICITAKKQPPNLHLPYNSLIKEVYYWFRFYCFGPLMSLQLNNYIITSEYQNNKPACQSSAFQAEDWRKFNQN